MTAIHDDENDVPDLSNRELLRVLMQEIVDVRKELKEDITDVSQRVGSVEERLDGVEQGLAGVKQELASVKREMGTISSDLKGLRFQVHQNHTSFITNQQDLEKRVTALEAA